MMIEGILRLADALPSGRIDPKSLDKLATEFSEFVSACGQGDRPGAYLELADVVYYACKVLALACDLASDTFGITVTPEDALDLAVAKYTLRAAPGNPKNDVAERHAIARWAGATYSSRPCNCGNKERWEECSEHSSYCG